MNEPEDRLYALLPAWHRQRDRELGEPLRALLRVMERELNRVEGDVQASYDNAFIETCAEWAVPYIGELLGVAPLNPLSADDFSLRAYIANTLSYRRGKGTPAVIEQVARDLTGWPARAVEFFQLLSVSQYTRHTRLHCHRTPDLRAGAALARLHGPFSSGMRTGEVRRIATGRGHFNIPNVGVYLWRLRDHTLVRAFARPYGTGGDGRFVLDPTGRSVAMYNPSRAGDGTEDRTVEADVPSPLSRRLLWSEREGLEPDKGANAFFTDDRPFEIFVDGSPISAYFRICDLADFSGGWQRPPTSTVGVPDEQLTGRDPDWVVGIDPERGRVVIGGAGPYPTEVRVTWTTAFSGSLGGGPYDRTQSVATGLPGEVTWQRGVSRVESSYVDSPVYLTVIEAITAWNALVDATYLGWVSTSGTVPPQLTGVIVLMDNGWHEEDLTGINGIKLAPGARLMIVAAQWPAEDDPDTGVTLRPLGSVTASGRRACLVGNVEVLSAAGTEEYGGALVLDGVWIDGTVRVLEGDLRLLRIAHSTLVPAQGGITIEAGNSLLTLELDHAITGPITTAPGACASLTSFDSVIDAAQVAPSANRLGNLLRRAVVAYDTRADVQRSTVLGGVEVRQLDASDSVLSEAVLVERQQTGCVRYCSLPDDVSQTPRRFRCQPDLALAARHAEPDWATASAAERIAADAVVRRRLRPAFTTTDWGGAAYVQLGLDCPAGVRTGASDGSEMGAWCELQAPLREANLRAALPDYVRLGLEAGLFYVT